MTTIIDQAAFRTAAEQERLRQRIDAVFDRQKAQYARDATVADFLALGGERSDVDALQDLAAMIVAFTDRAWGPFAKLSGARDVQEGYRTVRSTFDRDYVLASLSETFGNLLSAEAGAVLNAEMRGNA